MSDRRTTPVNGRVAAAHLADAPAGLERMAGQGRQVVRPLTDLLRTPDGPRDRQFLLGDLVQVYEDRNGWSFVQADKDGYVGYVASADLGPVEAATHWVRAPATHVYAAANIKSPDCMSLSFASRIAARSETGGFVETAEGFVPRVHLAPIGTVLNDPAGVAALFLGTPYLWGGNSRFGIDCSGLVQAALLACAIPCPGDSDQQQAELGTTLSPGTPPLRGDLLFWKGHVALVSDPDTLIHANGYHMAVSLEPLHAAIARIEGQGDGPVVAHKRL